MDNERGEFPPDVYLEDAQCRGKRCPKRDCDRQADESHHAGLVAGQFAPCSTDKNEPAVKEDRCS